MSALPNTAQDLLKQIESIPVMNNAFVSWLRVLNKSSEDVISVNIHSETQQISDDGLWIKKALTGYTTVTLAFSDKSSSVQVFNMNWEPQLAIIAVYDWKV